MSLNVCRGLASLQVFFCLRNHDAGGCSFSAAIEYAADTAVGENVADAEFIGVVHPFDDDGSRMNKIWFAIIGHVGTVGGSGRIGKLRR